MKLKLGTSLVFAIIVLHVSIIAQGMNEPAECSQFQGYRAGRVIQLQSDSTEVLGILVRDGYRIDKGYNRASSIRLSLNDAYGADTTYILTFHSSSLVGVAIAISTSAQSADVEFDKAVAHFSREYGEPSSSSNSGKTIYGWIAQCTNHRSNKVLVSSQSFGSPDDGRKMISMAIAPLEEERHPADTRSANDTRTNNPNKAVDFGLSFGFGDTGTTFGLSFGTKNVFLAYSFFEAKKHRGAETMTGIDVGVSYTVFPFFAPFAGVGVYDYKANSFSNTRTITPTQTAGFKLALSDAFWISAAYHTYRGTVVSIGLRSYTE